MYKAIKDDKIIAVNESGNFPCLFYDSVVEDTEHNLQDFIHCDGEFVLTTDEKAIEMKKEEVRAVRNSYLEQYVDPYQLVIRWNTLSQAEQEDLTNYRQYLLDYTSGENWWENEPMTYEEWLVAHHPVVDVESEA